MFKEVLVNLVKSAISDALNHTRTLDTKALVQEYPELANPGASFVTLTLDGNLRGCIGSLVAHRPLIEDIILNACSSALEDPRFTPLTPEEFLNIKVEVSILSEPVELIYKSIPELKSKVTKQDGVVLRLGSRQATFLPQVWKQLPTFELFFSSLCKKAALDELCLENHPEIFVYHVKEYQE